MSDPKIEEIARAIAQEDGDHWWSSRPDYNERWLRYARAAYEVMAGDDGLDKLCARVEADAVAGLRYIERHYGRLEGVGWDRVFDAHDDLFRRAADAQTTPPSSNEGKVS